MVNPTGGSVIDPPGIYISNKPKTRRTVSIKSINAEATWQIETEADVDRYVEELKAKLKKSIEKDIILNVEF